MADRTWHITGWRTYTLADTKGRVLGSVRDGSALATAYVEGKGRIGDYLNVEYAKVAVEKALTPEVPRVG